MKPTKFWAIVDQDGKILSGDYRPFMYWTRAKAKKSRLMLGVHRNVEIVRVVATAVGQPTENVI